MRNKEDFVLSLFFALVLVLSPALVFAGGNEERLTEPASSINGVITYLEGEVTINGIQADFGSEVSRGAEVRTGPSSVADIVFAGQNVMRLSENTLAVIDIGETRKQVDLKTGAFSGIFAKLEGIAGTDKLEVRTPTAVAGIRGTTFFVKVLDEDTTYICDCNGTVGFRDAAGTKAFERSAPKHEAYLFTRRNGDIDVVPGEDTYHSSAELNKLADTIGVVIPWGRLEKETFK